ncbi:MAG: SRPBCC family protein [Verrucomicrobia bacterium]|nr:SRPBCC family protein [Verrucomicrobiota bacterium]
MRWKSAPQIVIGILSISILVVVSTTARQSPLNPSSTPPPVDHHGFVSHTEVITVQVPMQFFRQWRQTSSGHLGNTLRGTSKIAGVAYTEMIRGTWPQPGARRRVVRKDGNESLEEVLENSWPTRFRYEVWGFTDQERILTNYLVGEFQYRGVPEGTEVKWTYSFHRRYLLTTPILSIEVHNRVPEFMRTALQSMKEEAEEAYSKDGTKRE